MVSKRWLVAIALVGATALEVAAEVRNATPTGAPAEGQVAARTSLLDNWRAQAESLAKATGQVQAKLDDAIVARGLIAKAALVMLRYEQVPPGDLPSALAVARRRASMRWLLAYHRREVQTLATERDLLADAATTVMQGNADAASVPLPPTGLAWPTQGEIVRKFGTFEHPRSKATLMRRGLDFETAIKAPAVAVADGTILYIGAIRGMDHGVIVDHGTFVTVTTKLGTTVGAAGDRVERGQRLGQALGSRIYFELRANVGPEGTPLDPLPFFQKR